MTSSMRPPPEGASARKELYNLFARALMRHFREAQVGEPPSKADAESSQNPLGSGPKQSVYPQRHETHDH